MTFDELNEEQKLQVKQNYLIGLADDGVFIKTIYGDDEEPERGPSWGELADADELVSDETIRSQGVEYDDGDFS